MPPRTRIAQRVYEELRSDLLRAHILPGERVTEQWAAERYNASRTPIREACRRLSDEGLLVHSPGEGYRAPGIDPREVSELYEVRLALEDLSARRACVADGRDDALGVLRTMWSELVTDPREEVVFLDEEFHLALARLSGNNTLVQTLRGINLRIRLLRVHDFRDRGRIVATVEEHLAILAAVEDGDAALAAALMVAHITESQQAVAEAAERARSALAAGVVGALTMDDRGAADGGA